MTQQFVKDGPGWGFALWLFGYLFGFALFPVVPVHAIGWIITPIATIVTIWVLLRFVKGESLAYYGAIGAVWLVIAVVCDYVFLVRLLQPADGYYKADVYLYYVLTLVLPPLIGWWKLQPSR